MNREILKETKSLRKIGRPALARSARSTSRVWHRGCMEQGAGGYLKKPLGTPSCPGGGGVLLHLIPWNSRRFRSHTNRALHREWEALNACHYRRREIEARLSLERWCRSQKGEAKTALGHGSSKPHWIHGAVRDLIGV